MDVSPLLDLGLPTDLDAINQHSDATADDLWEWARAYNRVRRKHLKRKLGQRCEQLKARCIVLALDRRTDLFLHFLDPGSLKLRLFYHVEAKTLLHLPADVSLEVTRPCAVAVRCPE